ncbi:MAG: AMP-binding protein [Defluviitaleaceae bacterium]|nr:AMP-binding protein [Defluviitaleaceae bacterium]
MKNRSYPLYKVDEVNNLKELAALIANKHGDNNAFTFERYGETVSVSYRQFQRDIDAFGTALLNSGVEKTKVAVIGENSYEWIVTYFAAVNSGNVIVPLDKELPEADIKHLIDDSETEVFVYSDGYSEMAAYLKENAAGIRRFIHMQEVAGLMEEGTKLIRGGDTRMADYVPDNRAFATLLYTSGTSGVSKGVMLTHYSLAKNATGACYNIEILGSNVLVLPLHHSFGFTAGVCSKALWGSEICINDNLKNVLSDIQKYKPANILLVPLFLEKFHQRIWSSAKKQGKDGLLRTLIKVSNGLLRVGIDLRRVLFKSVLSAFGGNLKLIISGGAPIDTKYTQGLRDFGIQVLNGYGITECSPIVAVNRNGHFNDKSVGPVLPCCQVKISKPDENGHGEILVKGDIVMLGYYNNEQATKEAFDGEWFKTGDIGYFGPDGFLYISGRLKNLIVLSNGKNVYPEEVEFELIRQIPYIQEAVVSDEDGEIAAEVFLNTEDYPDCASNLDKDIQEFNKNMPLFKNVGRTKIRDVEFPKTTTKKIKRTYK